MKGCKYRLNQSYKHNKYDEMYYFIDKVLFFDLFILGWKMKPDRNQNF